MEKIRMKDSYRYPNGKKENGRVNWEVEMAHDVNDKKKEIICLAQQTRHTIKKLIRFQNYILTYSYDYMLSIKVQSNTSNSNIQ